MGLIDTDAFEVYMNERLLPVLIDKYGEEEAMRGLHFSFRDVLMNVVCAPTVDAVEVIRCKDCKHQEKFFHKDARRKDGGYYIYGCELADGYSHVCLDDDFCSRAERREDG